MERDYLALCAGTGWWTVEHFHNQFHFSRVVAFATRRDPFDDERNEIVGIDQIRLNERLNSTIKDSKWFRGYVHDDDFEVIGKQLRPQVEEYLLSIQLPKAEGR